MATDAALNLLATSAVTCAQAEATSDLTDNEIMIHTIAHKKLSDKLSVEDLTFLQNYESDGSPKSDLFLLSVKLLKKEKLSALEEELLVLSLSGIYNYLNPLIVEIYAKEINRPFPPQEATDDNEVEAFNKDITEILEAISQIGNMNETLFYLQTEKATLSRNNKRSSDRHTFPKTLSFILSTISDNSLLLLWSKKAAHKRPTSPQRLNLYPFSLQFRLTKTPLLLNFLQKFLFHYCTPLS